MALELIPNAVLSVVLASSINIKGDAEINAYNAATQQVYVTTADGLAMVDIKTPNNIKLQKIIDFTQSPYSFTNKLTSVASQKGLTAVSISAKSKQQPGRVILLGANGKMLSSIEVGPLPDMVTFTPDGKHLLV